MGKPTPGQFQVTHSISCLISLLVAGLWIQSEIQSILGLQLFQRRKTWSGLEFPPLLPSPVQFPNRCLSVGYARSLPNVHRMSAAECPPDVRRIVRKVVSQMWAGLSTVQSGVLRLTIWEAGIWNLGMGRERYLETTGIPAQDYGSLSFEIYK